MTLQELMELGAISFEHIDIGFSEYNHRVIKLGEKDAISHLKRLREEYGRDNAFVDFYYFRLDEYAKEEVQSQLTPVQIAYLDSIKPENVQEQIVFPLEDIMLSIIAKLNATEMLFSTVYFLESKESGKTRTTWWGNYNQEYVCFMDL